MKLTRYEVVTTRREYDQFEIDQEYVDRLNSVLPKNYELENFEPLTVEDVESMIVREMRHLEGVDEEDYPETARTNEVIGHYRLARIVADWIDEDVWEEDYDDYDSETEECWTEVEK